MRSTIFTVLAAAVVSTLADPVAFRASYGDGALQRYRVACTEYKDDYCQQFLGQLKTAACGSFQHNWQAYWLNDDFGYEYVFDVSVVKGVAGAAAITCAINGVTGQGAYADDVDNTACDNYPNANTCEFNGIST